MKNYKTPSTVFCKDRKETKKLPDINKRFSFSEEIITNDQIVYLTVSNFKKIANIIFKLLINYFLIRMYITHINTIY